MSDDGETWNNERIIDEHDSISKNRMCPHLIRLRNGDIGLVSGRKFDETGAGMGYFTLSSDEGIT